jgi:hypothetical protein
MLQLFYMLQGHPTFQHHLHQQLLPQPTAQLEAARRTPSTPQLTAGEAHSCVQPTPADMFPTLKPSATLAQTRAPSSPVYP